MSKSAYSVSVEQANSTVAAIVRAMNPEMSWANAGRLISSRKVKINGELCLDPARRLREGETVEVLAQPVSAPRERQEIVIRFSDEHVVVVEKPAGISTVRHPAERDWPDRRRKLAPTLDDLVTWQLRLRRPRRLRIVQRLDKETSGLLVFARTVLAEQALGKQFRDHTVTRRYLAVVPGRVAPQTIRTRLVPDRGDRRRGSTTVGKLGKAAVTHVKVAEQLQGYTLLECRLETGRTHQIRIHLAELGNPVCGEKVYHRQPDGTLIPDNSGTPRLALHAADLGFRHPVTQRDMSWSMALPGDLESLLEQLRRK